MDTISLERTGPSQVGSSQLVSGWVRSSDLASEGLARANCKVGSS